MIHRLHVPFTKPADVIPHLAKQQLHWKAGYSAQELAISWFKADNDFPAAVRAALDTAPEYAGATLIDGHLECEVDLGTRGSNSQSDIVVIAGLQGEIAVIAVEGKVNEPFDKLVGQWNDSAGKQTRLDHLCETLDLDPKMCDGLRYQLLHRTASAVYEARRYRCRHAMMLVHSFSPTHRWFEDFSSFALAMRMPVEHPGQCSIARVFEGISLRLCWVSDVPDSLA